MILSQASDTNNYTFLLGKMKKYLLLIYTTSSIFPFMKILNTGGTEKKAPKSCEYKSWYKAHNEILNASVLCGTLECWHMIIDNDLPK